MKKEEQDESKLSKDVENMEDVKKQNLHLIAIFLSTKKLEGCTPQTLKMYHDTLILCALQMSKKFTEMTTIEIREYLSDYQEERKISNHSLDNMRRVFSSFYNYLEEENYILSNPVRKIHRIKGEKIIHSPFSDDEIVRIQDSCPTIRELAMIDFLNSSGVRVSELCSMNKNDIDLISRQGLVFGKGSKERIIYIDARTKVHLQMYLRKRTDDNPALFVTAKEPYSRITKSGVEFIVKTIGEIADVPKCHPHRFRRSLATRLIDRGVPIEQVQKILGHAKIDTTLIYAEVNQQNIKISHTKFAS